tara:strand:- start:1234 stop:1533 length:300 start_codon:yes stop_codon:yes gene_type:complete
MKTMKLICNKDGEAGRKDETFATYCPNTYRVEDASGAKIGEFTQHIRIRGPHRDIEWMGTIKGEFYKFQRLTDVRTYLKNGTVPPYAIVPNNPLRESLI